WYMDTGRGLGALSDDFQTHMRYIATVLGTESKAGRNAVAENVSSMVDALRKSMDDGKVSVTSGMREMRSALQTGMRDNATSWRTSWPSMFDTVTSLYDHGKLDAAGYVSQLRTILNDGNKHIRADNHAGYVAMIDDLKAQEQKGVLSSQEFKTAQHQAFQEMNANNKTDMAQFASQIATGFASATEGGAQGMTDIVKTVNSALKLLGQSPLTGLQVSVMSATGQNNPRGSTTGYAAGGLMQIGVPGQAGRDTVPLNVGGIPVVVAPGEQVAVFNRHQLPIVNQALAGYGGLPGLFSTVSTPNYMSSGGFVADPGTNFSVGQEPQIAAALNRLAQALGVSIYGISGYRSPAHSVAVGGYANDPHTRGQAADIGVNSQSRASA
ncbi:MAG: D-Ala-D-Ala carboxypeptidase family metallohydrolase, partial [Trebonia sp.]